MKMYAPMMLDLRDKKVTIIGGGKVAYRKACYFMEFGSAVTVISPCFIKAFQAKKLKLQMREDYYRAEYLEDSFIVVAATDDPVLNTQIGLLCKKKGKLCNIVSNEPLSSLIVPAFLKRGELIISVSTGGNSPYLARKIREKLEKDYPPDYGVYVTLLGEIRKEILKQDLKEEEKSQLLEQLTHMDLSALRKYREKIETKG